MMNVTPFRKFSGAALAAFALAVPAVSRAQSYTITDLGASVPGAYSVGSAINSSGQVAGYFQQNSTTIPNAVSWTGPHAVYYNSFGGYWSYGYGINDSGSVTGVAFDDYNYVTFAYVGNGMTTLRLDSLGGYANAGYAVNNSGQAAGSCETRQQYVSHAVRWTGTSVQDLGTLGGVTSEGVAINASGQVAGYSDTTTANVIHAVLWTGATATDLGTLGGANSYAYGINDSGQIVGSSDTALPNVTHAVLWQGAAMTDLGTLGGASSSAYAINNRGDVVGTAQRADGSSALFLYTGGRMRDITALLPAGSGWSITSASGINDSGQICGTGGINGQMHAFLLTPITATVTGQIGLEGVADLSYISPAAPLGTFHIGFRTPNTTTEVYGADVTLTTTPGGYYGSYIVPNVPVGVYDVTFKGAKNLRVSLPGVTISGATTLTTVTLPAGDANNDNSVDSTDFGVLIGAFGSEADIPGSGYDATADFNFDGFVDSADFGLLINEYNNAGAP